VQQTKYIVVTGGVISGLGKGGVAASIGHLFSGKFKVIPIKCDGYLNVDPGTMNPFEHGEVFVLDDGGEVDMDFGHYERFLGIHGKIVQMIELPKHKYFMATQAHPELTSTPDNPSKLFYSFVKACM